MPGHVADRDQRQHQRGDGQREAGGAGDHRAEQQCHQRRRDHHDHRGDQHRQVEVGVQHGHAVGADAEEHRLGERDLLAEPDLHRHARGDDRVAGGQDEHRPGVQLPVVEHDDRGHRTMTGGHAAGGPAARPGTRRPPSSTGRPARTRPGTGSSAYRRFEAEGARPGEDRRGEDRVQHRVAVLGAHVAAEQRLKHADEQPGDQRPAGLAEPAVGGGDEPGQRDRRARQVGEPVIGDSTMPNTAAITAVPTKISRR